MPDPEVKETPIAFDSKAFMAEMLGEFDKRMDTKLNGAINTLDKKISALEKKPPEVKPEDKPEEKPDELKSIAQLNARLNDMAKENETLKKDFGTEKDLRTKAEAAELEGKRISAFQEVINVFEFATPKAKQQFTAAYLPRVERGEDGGLFIKGDKGDPMEMAAYLKTEYTESTHLQPMSSRGGAGVTPGTKTGTGSGFKYDPNMTPAQVAALSPEHKAAYREELAAAL